MGVIPAEDEGGESRENDSEMWKEKQEAPRREKQGAIDGGDGGENRSRSVSSNNDAAYAEGGVAGGGWNGGGYATDAPMLDDGNWAREASLLSVTKQRDRSVAPISRCRSSHLFRQE